MTREEAICELSVIWERLSHPEDCENGCYSFRDGDYTEALDMAIEALHREEAEEKGYCHRIRPSNVEVVVRCKDCKWWSGSANTLHNNHLCKRALDQNVEYWTRADDYCSYGERKGGDDE